MEVVATATVAVAAVAATVAAVAPAALRAAVGSETACAEHGEGESSSARMVRVSTGGGTRKQEHSTRRAAVRHG